MYDFNGNKLNKYYDFNGNVFYNDIITVMTFNVQKQGQQQSSIPFQKYLLDKYNPDFVGYQEFRDTINNQNAYDVLNYPYYEDDKDKVINYNGIISKMPFKETIHNAYTDSVNGDNNGYQLAIINVNGKEVCFINTHLTTSTFESKKVAQANELFNVAKQYEYFIILGDFNTVCKSVDDTEYTTIMEQFVDYGCHSVNCTPQNGFIDTWTGERITYNSGNVVYNDIGWYPCDHVITSSNIDILDFVIDYTKLTNKMRDFGLTYTYDIDHLPIIAHLRIN